MKRSRKLLSVLFSLVLIISLTACGQSGQGNTVEDLSKEVTRGELAALLEQEADEATAEETLTNQEVVRELLLWTGMEEERIGTSQEDFDSFADSLGMVKEIEEYDPTAVCTKGNLNAMKAVADSLHTALSAEKLEPLFLNGMAQPIFPYTSGAVEEGYSNEESDIVRYCVYVETNYDTDGDGKLDLVKALVQLPKAAVEGNYQAATIYEARPYITGCTPFEDISEVPGSDGFDMQELYSQPAAREASGTATTQEAAEAADSKDWYYFNPYEDMYDYEDLDWYDYFLVRGYAVVECAGLGTRGSEGYETCGSDLEIDAFKCVIEWLHGDRVAYTDKTSNIAIEADWSNGNVGMTGRSYGGTTQFGLAATGVEGLKTIVPVAGIASWYEYLKCQGITIDPWSYDQLDGLALYCAGRYLDEDDWSTIEKRYGNYLHQLQADQEEYGSDYSDTWANRDYTLGWENIKCSALIVHGLNDDNVRTKQFDLMYQAFQKAGQTTKLLLHQGAHITPTYPGHELAFHIGDTAYDSILNQWFSHYLYDLDNGAENMPNVLAQSNYDTDEWTEYEKWETENTMTLTASAEGETTEISSDYASVGIDDTNKEESFAAGSTKANATYFADVTEDTVIKGSVAVNFKAAATDSVAKAGVTRDNLMVSAMLVDVSEEAFQAFNVGEDYYVPKTMIKEGGVWLGGGLTNLNLTKLQSEEVNYKVIASGWMDLCNPDAGYDSASAANGIQLKENEYHDYTLYLQPNLYTVKAGHKLALVICTYDPYLLSYDQNYTVILDNSSITANIPVESTAGELTAVYTEKQ